MALCLRFTDEIAMFQTNSNRYHILLLSLLSNLAIYHSMYQQKRLSILSLTLAAPTDTKLSLLSGKLQPTLPLVAEVVAAAAMVKAQLTSPSNNSGPWNLEVPGSGATASDARANTSVKNVTS